jgi:hypothetical protein
MEVHDILPERSMADVIAQRVRVQLGGREYLLPAKVIDDNERWKRQLDVVMTALLASMDEDGDAGSALGVLSTDPEPFVQVLLSYDHTGLLPDRDTLRATVTEYELLVAVLECWRAASPKVDIALVSATTAIRTGTLPRLTSSLLPGGAGTLRRSEAN